MTKSNILSGMETFSLESGNTLQVNYDNKLGEGSFGAVYQGRYVGANGITIDPDVAIKILKPSDDGGSASDPLIDKEYSISILLGLAYEKNEINGSTWFTMKNLGREIPDMIDAGKRITDTVVKKNIIAADINDIANKISALENPIEGNSPLATTPSSQHDISDLTGTFVQKPDASEPTGTFVQKPDTSEPTGTFVQKPDTSEPTGTFVTPGNQVSVDSGSSFNVIHSFVVNNKPDPTHVSEVSHPNPAKPGGLKHLAARIATGEDKKNQVIVNPTTILQKDRGPIISLDMSSDETGIHFESTISIFKQMAEEVKNLHEHGVIHLDIKGTNFLYKKETSKVTIIDFGISEYLNDQNPKVLKGTIGYIAPELCIENPTGVFSTDQDVYSLGKCYIMCVCQHISQLNPDATFYGAPLGRFELAPEVRNAFKTTVQLGNIQFKNDSQDFRIDTLNQLITLMNTMTEINPDKRPSMDAILNQLKIIESNHLCQTVLNGQTFEGNKMGDRFLAKNAIHDYNRKQLQQWHNTPDNKRGNKPTELAIPENTVLDRYISNMRHHHALSQPQNSRSHPISLGDAFGSLAASSGTQSTLNQRNSDASMQEIVKNIVEELSKLQHSAPAADHARRNLITPLMARFGGSNVRQSSIDLGNQLIESLNQVVNNNALSSDQKLEKMKTALESALSNYQNLNKGNIQKWNSSSINTVITDNIETITQLQKENAPSTPHNRLK